jgi:hypothetical protein
VTRAETSDSLRRWFRRSGPGEFVELCRRRENRSILIVSVVVAAFLARKAVFLVYPDLAFSYPFITFDGFQWLLDGDAYLGHGVTATYRNPGLPFVVLALDRLGLVRYLPVLTTLLLGGLFAYVAVFVRKHFDAVSTAIALLLIFLDFSVQTFFDYVLADQWAITFGFIAVWHLRDARDDARRLVSFGFWAAISFLFQYAIAFLVPAFLVYFFVSIRPAQGARSTKMAAIALAVAALVVAPVFLYKSIKFGNPIYSGVIYFPLVRVHFFGMFYYAVNFCAFFGIPSAVLIIYGFFKELQKGDAYLLVELCLVCYASFWVLFYSWLDPRFILYSVPFAAFALAGAISALRIPSLLSWNARRLPSMLVGSALVGFALLYALHDRGSPFTFDLLPLTPQTVLRFRPERITEWEGNFTINIDGARLENLPHGIPALSFVKSYYPRHRRSVDPAREQERAELRAAADAAKGRFGADYRIALCGPLASDYYSAMRREIVFRRRFLPCGEPAEVRLCPRDEACGRDEVIFAGPHYMVVSGHPVR